MLDAERSLMLAVKRSLPLAVKQRFLTLAPRPSPSCAVLDGSGFALDSPRLSTLSS